MLNPQQKQNLITCIVLVIILGLITACSRPQFNSNKPKPNQSNISSYDTKAYQEYLKSLQIDPKASEDLYQKVISEEDVKKQVEDELQVNQTIIMPTVDQSKIVVTNKTGSQAIVDYFSQHLSLLENWKDMVAGSSGSLGNLFDNGANSNAPQITQEFINQMYNLPVPAEAKALHESQIVALTGYQDLFSLGTSYNPNSTTKPWPAVYRDQVILETATNTFNKEFDKLNAKYSINYELQKQAESYAKGSFLVPSAHAVFGFGDIVIDIKAVIRDIIETALAAAFTQFMIELINKLVEQIEKSYKIANFLYYTDALVSGRYVDDYIDKYYGAATAALDKSIIKRFIPQIGCGLPKQDLMPFFRAQATQSLGFDPSTVSTNDPNYYSKMASVGDFLSSPQGWQVTYEDAASQAQASAERSSHDELVSAGLKAGRDPKSANEVATTAEVVGSSIKAALISFFNLGVVTSRTVAGKIAGLAVQTFIHSYIFKGAVYKEQSACVAVPVLSPVVPGTNAGYTPPPPVDEGGVLNESCASLPGSCTPGTSLP